MIFTEPYVDIDSRRWVVTLSQAVSQNNAVVGVVGIDVTLQSIRAKLQGITMLKSSFVLLLSAGGMIVTMPEQWQALAEAETFQVFEAGLTGISESQ